MRCLMLLIALPIAAASPVAARTGAAPPTRDDGIPRMACETTYTDRAGKRVALPLTITFDAQDKGLVRTDHAGKVIFPGSRFTFAGHPPVDVLYVLPENGYGGVSLFKLGGNNFIAVTTVRQDLSATVATFDLVFEERLMQPGIYREWTGRCRQISGF